MQASKHIRPPFYAPPGSLCSSRAGAPFISILAWANELPGSVRRTRGGSAHASQLLIKGIAPLSLAVLADPPSGFALSKCVFPAHVR